MARVRLQTRWPTQRKWPKIRAELKTAAVETAADGDATAAGPAGFASLKGRFFFDGTEPQRKVLETGAKGAECGLGGQPLLDNALLIDSGTKGIADVVVLLRSAKHKHPDMLKAGRADGGLRSEEVHVSFAGARGASRADDSREEQR